jgi:hypothetical protein
MLFDFFYEKKKIEESESYRDLPVKKYSQSERPPILMPDAASMKRFSPEIYKGILARIKHLEDL